MACLSMRVVAFSASLVAMGLGVDAASAQDCRDEITASGNARPTEAWAKSLATNMWRRQVQATYGEQFEDIKYAQNVNYVCSPTSFGRRCTLTATPCIVPGTGDRDRRPDPGWIDKGVPSDRDTVRALQQELKRLGCYDGPIDGDWGDGSRRGLERFARNAGVNLRSDEPTRRALRAAEETDRRVCR